MTPAEFFNKNTNEPLDFDGYYGDQCMDLFEFYNRDVVGAPFIPGNAIDLPNTYNKDFYEWVQNTPTNVPLNGDVMIWGVPIGEYIDDRGIKRYAGHVSIFDAGNEITFTSFDQNWPLGSTCHFEHHNYSNVLGWLHPKGSSPVPSPIPDPIPATPTPSEPPVEPSVPPVTPSVPPIDTPTPPQDNWLIRLFKRLYDILIGF
jgi:hypothetical protein